MKANATSGDLVLSILITSLIAVSLGLQLISVFLREVNWDEFFYLSHIYTFEAGTLGRALQTFHVYLFFWLPAAGGNEIAQIEMGRSIMWTLQLSVCACIYLIGRRLFGSLCGLFAVIAYLGINFVSDHGASFRADPLAASFAMSALSLIMLSRLRTVHLVMIAVALALATLITVKTAFYAPALVAAALWRMADTDNIPLLFYKMLGSAVLAAGLFVAAYFASLNMLPLADHSGSEAMMASAAENVFGLPTYAEIARFLKSLFSSPASWISFAFGCILAVRDLAWPEKRARAALVLALATPVLSLLFYRNAFPYFYPFILPPAAFLFAYAAHTLSRKKWQLAIFVILIVVPAINHSVQSFGRDQQVQSEIIDTVHRIFPEPVPYIDRNSMISSFPKHGIFMSQWGLRAYHKRGRPVIAELLDDNIVPLLIVNSPTLEHAIGYQPTPKQRYELLPQDIAALRRNFVHWWGAIWIAGKDLRLPAGCTDTKIVIPGVYSVEAKFPVRLAAANTLDQSGVLLTRGVHGFCTDNEQIVKLRWGASLYRPTRAATEDPVYQAF